MVTLQQAYDRLVQAALDGTFPSVNEKEECKLRADETPHCKKRCAIGLFVPDDVYNPGLEFGQTPNGGLSPSQREQLHLDIPPEFNPKILSVLQQEHDQMAFDISGSGEKWNPYLFIDFLNRLKVFEPCIKKYPEEEGVETPSSHVI